MANQEEYADTTTTPTLWTPYTMGKRWELRHRVVMAPLTRCRAVNHLPSQAHVEYYSQRATPGGLLFSEATVISPSGHGYPNCPGIYTEEQVEAWKKVTAAVHSRGATIFCQLWHVGRASHYACQPDGNPPISSTNAKISDKWKIKFPDGSYGYYSQPRALTANEIPAIVDEFRQAAINSIRAGFDGVEIHGAFGFLIDQFLKDGVNDRTDSYGGPLSNRCRFFTEVVESVVAAVGAHRVGVKISPTTCNDDAVDSDPLALGLAVVERLNRLQEGVGAELTHLQIQVGSADRLGPQEEAGVVRALRKVYRGTLMVCGGYDRERGISALARGEADLIAYGRLFISKPDLVRRFKENAKLNDYDASTFYTFDPVVGYTDYPFLEETKICSPYPPSKLYIHSLYPLLSQGCKWIKAVSWAEDLGGQNRRRGFVLFLRRSPIF